MNRQTSNQRAEQSPAADVASPGRQGAANQQHPAGGSPPNGPGKRQPARGGKLIPLIIFGMGIIPLFIGLFLYYNPSYLSGATTERGELINPPLDLRPWLGEPGKWQIMLLATKQCGEQCEQMFYYGRQVHEALKEERQQRVERVLFLEEAVELSPYQLEGLAAQSPKITLRQISAAELERLFAPYTATQGVSWRDLHNSIFLADPNGNLILRYEPITNVEQAKSLLKDLNHLLRISRIG